MSSSPSSRRRIVGVSTKMYFSYARTTAYVRAVLEQLPAAPADTDVFIIPDHVALKATVDLLSAAGSAVVAGAQDCHSEDAGAFTGEVSPAVLAEVGCRIVELGHAERRALFAETDHHAAAKAAAVVRNRMLPLVCVGEPDRAGGPAAAADFVAAQVRAVVDALPPDADLLLAYEPVWAIGAAQPAAPEHVVAVAAALRDLDCIRARSGTTRILYGGSAGPGLFEKLKGAVDGLFLGRFAHDPEQFLKTVKEVAEA